MLNCLPMRRLARPFSTRRIKVAVLTTLAVSPLMALLIGDQLDRRRRGPPPAGLGDLDSFLRWRKPGRSHLTTKDGREYLWLACPPVGYVWRGGPPGRSQELAGRANRAVAAVRAVNDATSAPARPVLPTGSTVTITFRPYLSSSRVSQASLSVPRPSPPPRR